jgi:hypothetical protein
MCNVRNHTRDYVTQYASLPFHPRFKWIEDKVGELYNKGADIVVLQVVRPMGCFFMGSDLETKAVWASRKPSDLYSRPSVGSNSSFPPISLYIDLRYNSYTEFVFVPATLR